MEIYEEMGRISMRLFGVLLAVLMVLVAPIARTSTSGVVSGPENGTEVVVATDTTEYATEVVTEQATTVVATEVATVVATEPTACDHEVAEVEPTASYVSESGYVEAEYYSAVDTEKEDYNTGYYSGYSDYDRELLARAIYAEAGCSWIPDDVQLSVGSVVLNRVQSGYYPDTIEGVLYDPGQYVPSSLYAAEPDERAYRNADVLLSGGSTLPANVLGQNGWGIGDGVYNTYYDEVLGTTIYFTYID